MSSMPSASMSRVRSVFLSLSGGAGTSLFAWFSLGGSLGVNGGWISCSGGGASPSLLDGSSGMIGGEFSCSSGASSSLLVSGCPSWPLLLCSGVGVLASLSLSSGLFGWLWRQSLEMACQWRTSFRCKRNKGIYYQKFRCNQERGGRNGNNTRVASTVRCNWGELS